MEIGGTKEHIMEAKSYFEEYRPDAKAKMTAAYIAVFKAFADGTLDVSLDLLDITISSGPPPVDRAGNIALISGRPPDQGIWPFLQVFPLCRGGGCTWPSSLLGRGLRS